MEQVNYPLFQPALVVLLHRRGTELKVQKVISWLEGSF